MISEVIIVAILHLNDLVGWDIPFPLMEDKQVMNLSYGSCYTPSVLFVLDRTNFAVKINGSQVDL